MNGPWLYLAALALGAGFAVPVAALSAALGQGRAGAAGIEGIARQPEAAGRIQTAMIIVLALIESLVIYALLISLILLFLVGFLLLVAVMKKYLFGPIGGILEARQNDIQGTLDQIQRDRQAMETSRQE